MQKWRQIFWSNERCNELLLAEATRMNTSESQEVLSVPVVHIFWSYAHEDTSHRDELEKHLAALKHAGHIQTWYDRDIQPGERWEQKIHRHLGSADLILPLIS